MAFPFGGHPRLADYIGQARKDHSAVAQSGSAASSEGKSYEVTKISIPKTGRSVVVVGVKQTDKIAPSMVGYLDRRLDISSPWFGIDSGDDV